MLETTRERNKPVGSKTVNKNGYESTKVLCADGTTTWRFTHHIKAEQYLGRALREDERVSFVTSNKRDFSKENIVVTIKGNKSKGKRIAQIEARVVDLVAELRELTSDETLEDFIKTLV